MMTDIIEKVALAILKHEWGQPVENVYEEDRQLARAVVKATLEAIRQRHIDAVGHDLLIDQLIKELDDASK